MKPGIKTTEFWVTLVANIISLTVVLGALKSEQAAEATRIASAITASVVTIVTALAYNANRTELKIEAQKKQ